MIKKLITMGTLLSVAQVAQAQEVLLPKDMRFEGPVAVAEEGKALFKAKEYGKQHNGKYILEKDILERCLNSYIYIHLGDHKLSLYAEEVAEERLVIETDSEAIAQYEAEIDAMGASAQTEEQILEYNDHVKAFNEVSAIHDQDVAAFNEKSQKLERFANTVKNKTLYFADRCMAKSYYQDDYEELMKGIQDRVSEEMDALIQ